MGDGKLPSGAGLEVEWEWLGTGKLTKDFMNHRPRIDKHT